MNYTYIIHLLTIFFVFQCSILRKIQTPTRPFITQKMVYMKKVVDLTKLLCHGDMMIICIWLPRKMELLFLLLLYLSYVTILSMVRI